MGYGVKVVYIYIHCKNKLTVLAIFWLLQLRNCPSYANSKNVVLVKTFCGRLVKFTEVLAPTV